MNDILYIPLVQLRKLTEKGTIIKMKKRNYYYIKATDIIMKITTGLLTAEISFFIPLIFFSFLIDLFNPYDYYFSTSIFWIKILLFFSIFSITYLLLERKIVRCMTLSDKRKVYLIYSFIKIIQSAIVSFCTYIMNIIYENLLYFIIFIVHAFILALSIISFVLCLMFSTKDTIENNN